MVYHINMKNRIEELPVKNKATPFIFIWRGEVVCDESYPVSDIMGSSSSKRHQNFKIETIGD